MFRQNLLALAILLGTAAAAQAGVGIICEGEGIDAHFPMGGSPAFSLLSAGVWVGDKDSRHVNDQGLVGGVPYQQSWVNDRVNIDLSDPAGQRVTVRVRLVSAPAYDLLAGFIEVVDDNAYPVTCSVG